MPLEAETPAEPTETQFASAVAGRPCHVSVGFERAEKADLAARARALGRSMAEHLRLLALADMRIPAVEPQTTHSPTSRSEALLQRMRSPRAHRRQQSAEVQFWGHVANCGAGDDDCWEWRGAIRQRYGAFGGIAAHRMAWMLHNGPIPDGLVILHRCDNPPCCNPRHLSPGTQAKNMADKSAKGRAAWNGGKSAFTFEQAERLRQKVLSGQTTVTEIASFHSVSRTYVSRTLRGVCVTADGKLLPRVARLPRRLRTSNSPVRRAILQVIQANPGLKLRQIVALVQEHHPVQMKQVYQHIYDSKNIVQVGAQKVTRYYIAGAEPPGVDVRTCKRKY